MYLENDSKNKYATTILESSGHLKMPLEGGYYRFIPSPFPKLIK